MAVVALLEMLKGKLKYVATDQSEQLFLFVLRLFVVFQALLVVARYGFCSAVHVYNGYRSILDCSRDLQSELQTIEGNRLAESPVSIITWIAL